MTTNDTSEPGAGLRAWQRAKTLRHDPDRIEKIGSDAAGIIEAALVREAEMLAIVAERDDLADTLLETTAEVRDVEQRGLALVAAAFEACVQRMREFPIDPGLPPQYQAPWNDLRALTPADAKTTLDAMLTKAREGGRAERLEPRNRRAPFRVGEHVRVVDGPHTGAHGPVDFVDPKGCRALIDFGGGRSGGLTWIAWGNLAAKAAP